MKCLNCQGENIVEDVGVVDRDQGSRRSLKLVTQTDPGAIIFNGTIEAPVHANACASCGYVMLFARPVDVIELKKGQSPLLS